MVTPAGGELFFFNLLFLLFFIICMVTVRYINGYSLKTYMVAVVVTFNLPTGYQLT